MSESVATVAICIRNYSSDSRKVARFFTRFGNGTISGADTAEE